MMISAWDRVYPYRPNWGGQGNFSTDIYVQRCKSFVRGAVLSSSRFKCVTIRLHSIYVLGGTYEYI